MKGTRRCSHLQFHPFHGWIPSHRSSRQSRRVFPKFSLSSVQHHFAKSGASFFFAVKLKKVSLIFWIVPPRLHFLPPPEPCLLCLLFSDGGKDVGTEENFFYLFIWFDLMLFPRLRNCFFPVEGATKKTAKFKEIQGKTTQKNQNIHFPG